jgi:hypothetical protein
MPIADADYSPLPRVTFGDPPVDVGPLYVPTPDYIVLSVYQTQRFPPDGRVIPQIATTFTIPGLPGQYIIRLDNYGFEHGDPLGRLRTRAALIRALYDID